MALARLCASPWFNDLIRHPRILDAIEDVIGANILVWTSTFFIKEPESPPTLPGTRMAPISAWRRRNRSAPGSH